MNPNKFGPIQLCLTAMLFFYFIELPDRPLRWIALGRSLLGLITVLFSLSRNTWLTLAILGVAFFFYFTRRLPVSKKMGLVIGLVILAGATYSLPMVQKRIDQGLQSIEIYFASEDYRDDSRLGSFGKRMELWKTGWYIFRENPLLGVGVGGFKPAAEANAERYRVNDYVKRKRYVHNQYLAALATRGIPGLILFLLVMIIPVYIAMRASSDTPSRTVARLSILVPRTGSTPHDGWVTHPASEPDVRGKLTKALLAFDPKKETGSEQLGVNKRITGYVIPEDEWLRPPD